MLGSPMSSEQPIVSIQYLRGVAALCVALHHMLAVPELKAYYTSQLGMLGVDIFFVISGFIMWSTTVGRQVSTHHFWIARIVRVVPLYWVFTALFICAASLLPSIVNHSELDPVHIIKSFLFIPAWHPTQAMVLPVYTLGWTLNYEMFFYLVFGLCLFVNNAPSRFICVVTLLVALSIAGLVIGETSGAVATSYTHPVILEFAAGAAIGFWAHSFLTRLGPKAFPAFSIFAVVWLTWAYSSNLSLFARHAPAAILIVMACISIEPLARRTPWAFGRVLGDASYSIYLAHPFAMRAWYFCILHVFPGAIWLYAITGPAIAIIAGLLVYYIVEQPTLTMSRRYRRSSLIAKVQKRP